MGYVGTVGRCSVRGMDDDMTTAWWLTVLALTAIACFAAGWIVHAELGLYRRMGTISFERRRL